MSLILKGIDLPADAEKVIIIIENKNNQKVYSIPSPQTDIIQIPKGHGRLTDGDWIKYNLENYSDLPTKYLHMDLVREAIEDAPTILEAEE